VPADRGHQPQKRFLRRLERQLTVTGERRAVTPYLVVEAPAQRREGVAVSGGGAPGQSIDVTGHHVTSVPAP
jgi:hypothetical protein